MNLIKNMMQNIRLAFAEYPRKGHSPDDSAIKFRPKDYLHMRGNVYGRIGGLLDKATRDAYLNAASVLATTYEKTSGDISCILKELKKL